MQYSKMFYLSLTLVAAGIMVEFQTAASLQPNNNVSWQLVIQQRNNGTLTLPKNQTSGIWFNNAPGYKVNCVNQARFNGRSCVCLPPAKLNKIIETYDGTITSTVWECKQVQDEQGYNDKE